MRFGIILAPEAVEDRARLRAVDRSAVDDALERHLRHEPGKAARLASKGCVDYAVRSTDSA
jgi:hypothetical protein